MAKLENWTGQAVIQTVSVVGSALVLQFLDKLFKIAMDTSWLWPVVFVVSVYQLVGFAFEWNRRQRTRERQMLLFAGLLERPGDWKPLFDEWLREWPDGTHKNDALARLGRLFARETQERDKRMYDLVQDVRDEIRRNRQDVRVAVAALLNAGVVGSEERKDLQTRYGLQGTP